jgi:hypothetical protein
MTQYNLYRAEIEGKREESNRYLLRVLPHMADFPDAQLLPDFPNFFQNEQPAYNRGDKVWIICEEDFQIGYVLGLCEPSIGSSYISIMKNINEAEEEAGFPPSAPSNISFYQQLEVALDFFNRSNNQCGRILTNGVVILYGFDGSFFIKNPGSAMLFSADGRVTIKTKDVEEDFKNVNIKAQEVQEKFAKLSTQVDGNTKITTGGNLQMTAGGNRLESVGGSLDTTVIKTKRETIGAGERKRIVLGGSSTVALAGNINQKAVTGAINLEGVTLKITGGNVHILGGTIKLDPSISMTTPPGFVVPSYVPGPFCAIPICPVTGMPHTGSTFIPTNPVGILALATELLSIPPV